MRFRDFLLNKAILRNYRDKILNSSDNTLVDKIYFDIANKFGYELIVKENGKNIDIKDKNWKNMLMRCPCGEDKKRFLYYSIKNKKSYYFDENGSVYEAQFCNNGYNFKLINYDKDEECYEKYNDFLVFSFNYFKQINDMKKQYMLIGFDNDIKYYVGNDSMFYIKKGNGEYKLCGNLFVNKFNKLLNTLNK